MNLYYFKAPKPGVNSLNSEHKLECPQVNRLASVQILNHGEVRVLPAEHLNGSCVENETKKQDADYRADCPNVCGEHLFAIQSEIYTVAQEIEFMQLPAIQIERFLFFRVIFRLICRRICS